MTASRLLAMICAGIFAQIFIGVVWAMARRRRGRAGHEAPSRNPTPPPVAAAAWPDWLPFRIVGRSFEDTSESQCSFALEPVDGQALPPFRPGQFLTFALLVGRSDQPAIVRCYSLSDRPRPDSYRITVKRAVPPPARPEVPPGAGSSWWLDGATIGDIVSVRAPAGQFNIDDDATVPAVFIAGGIGITPMLSMILWCLDAQPTRRLHLYYGLRNTAERGGLKNPDRALSGQPA